MTENSSDRGEALSTVQTGSLGGEAAWRVSCRILLLLLNSFLILLLLRVGVEMFCSAWGNVTYSTGRELALSGMLFVSPIAMAIATVLASTASGWLGISPVLSSLHMAALSNVLHFATLGIVMNSRYPGAGEYAGLAGWAEFVGVLGMLMVSCLATISTGLLLWVNAPLRR